MSAVASFSIADSTLRTQLAKISDEQILLLVKKMKEIMKRHLPIDDLYQSNSNVPRAKIVNSWYNIKAELLNFTPFAVVFKSRFSMGSNKALLDGAIHSYSLKDLVEHAEKEGATGLKDKLSLVTQKTKYKVMFFLDTKQSKEKSMPVFIIRQTDGTKELSQDTISLSDLETSESPSSVDRFEYSLSDAKSD